MVCRLVRLLTAGMLAGIALVPIAHAADHAAIGWILTRIGNDPRAIDGTLVASGISDESAVVMFATTGTGAQRRVDYRFVTTTEEWGADGSVHVNDAAVPDVPCMAACESPVGFARTVYISSSGRALHSTVYVAAYDVRDAQLSVGAGWRVKPWTPSWHSLTTATARGSTMVTAAHEAAGTYRGAQLTGGPYGSFASALLPCDYYGEGAATFSGGTRAKSMSCGGLSAAVDSWPKRTTWRVAGEVTCEGSATDVLIVVDFPR